MEKSKDDIVTELEALKVKYNALESFVEQMKSLEYKRKKQLNEPL